MNRNKEISWRKKTVQSTVVSISKCEEECIYGDGYIDSRFLDVYFLDGPG